MNAVMFDERSIREKSYLSVEGGTLNRVFEMWCSSEEMVLGTLRIVLAGRQVNDK